ncbi:MAG: hypothetical protein ABL900_01500 [Burkholderiaceae bacterium]
MHVLIPFASSPSEAATHVLHDLRLPALARLLQLLTPAERIEGDETTLSPPHERALAAAWGWPLVDGGLPFAARAAAADGIAVGGLAWGLLTPTHWSAGRDHVTLLDPASLALDEAESRAFFEAVRTLFESEGFTLAWGAPLRWYAAHESLSDLPCASLDRAVGRNIDTWLPKTPPQRLLRRLQSEVQLLLYTHPLNQAREDRGELAVNSFWLSGCGVWRPQAVPHVEVQSSLRAPLLGTDWAAWAEAWQALDAGPLAELVQRCATGEQIALTLCGERHAQAFEAHTRSLWSRVASRWRSASPAALLEAL